MLYIDRIQYRCWLLYSTVSNDVSGGTFKWLKTAFATGKLSQSEGV